MQFNRKTLFIINKYSIYCYEADKHNNIYLIDASGGT